MDFLSGVLERITFVNEENGFSVIKLKAKGYSDLVTVVGNLAGVSVGEVLEIKGFWKNDGKYGKQLVVEEYRQALPASVEGIRKYLGSGLIKGIGPVYAKKIVDHFKEDTLDVIENQPDRLFQVAGVGKKKVEIIKKAWGEQREIKNVMIFLQGHGVATRFAVKIYKAYGDDAIKVVKENPYRLADDIWGIGFKTADAIAKKLGIEHDSLDRIKSGVLFALGVFSAEGHCFAQRDELVAQTSNILEVDEILVKDALEKMIDEKKVMCEEDGIYPLFLYYSEVGVASRINAIISEPSKFKGEDVQRAILDVEEEFSIKYDVVQKESIESAVDSKFMVLTGGPGTGKTTTTLGIIHTFKSLGANILLAAPTGRAAKRLSEATNMEAKTVHRLLEFSPQDGYKRCEENPLTCDLLIVDEASMLDIMLMNNLLKAVSKDTCVILVGDVDQLPSVGPGNVLKDIINCGKIKVVVLKRIFRQAQGSQIIVNAHGINEGKVPQLVNKRDADFFFIEQENPSAILQTIKDLCKTRLPNSLGLDPIEDIQVLCPMQRGDIGARNINEVLQEALNKSREYIKIPGNTFKIGDKVMQIKNNYDKNVFNGDIGRIMKIDHEEKSVFINFDDNLVEYDGTELDEVVLAYATTIHKSQGSEYKAVIAPIAMQHYVMLQRNLLYTCVTRAKKLIVLVGSKKSIAMAVKNDKIAYRNTMLAKRIEG